MIRPSYRIVDYDPVSPALFEEEKTRILTGLEIDGDRLAHIGSTAVPGLAAKPIVDMMAGLTRVGSSMPRSGEFWTRSKSWSSPPRGTLGWAWP